MSEFVNYNKRDVSLPLGCKDLIDVLKSPLSFDAPGFDAVIAQSKQGVACSIIALGTLTDISRHVKNVRSSRAVLGGVFISLPGKQYRVGFYHVRARRNTRLWVLATEYDEAMREFFGAHGLSFQRLGKPLKGLPGPQDAATPG
ncbi:MAG: hypothetical protein ACREIC_12830 [Limisphaerales bacterium]